MKRKIVLSCLLLIAFLMTSIVPLGVFAEGQVFSISGFVEVREMGGSIFPQADIGIPENPKLPDGFVEGLKKGIKVTVIGTDFSAVTDANGYFEIKNIPAKETGYVLKFKGAGVEEKQVIIDSFTKDVVYEKTSPLTLKFSWDLNGDGVINMSDFMVIAANFNQVTSTYKISGYIDIIKMPMPPGSDDYLWLEDILSPGYAERQRGINGLKEGVKVTIDGTDLTATSDDNGYFEINNVPAKAAGYTLKFTRKFLRERQVVIDSFTKDVAYDKSSPVILQFSYDLDGNGAINMQDIVNLAALNVNQKTETHKISGYIAPNFEAKDSSIKSLFKVKIDETISTFTDENGYFEFESILKNETGYTLKISKPNYLYHEVKIDSLISDLEVSSIEKPIIMNIGDINGDNAINITDIMRIASAFNTKAGVGKYEEKYDLNMDGAINLIDILTIAKSFNKTAVTFIISL